MNFSSEYEIDVEHEVDSSPTNDEVSAVLAISAIIIQQIFTMPIYGKEALNICHPYMTDILRYT